MSKQNLLSANPLLGQEIHRRFDELGPIQVFDDGNKRYLSFGTTDEQSCQLKSQPFQLQHDYLRCMLAVLSQYPQPLAITSATVLGLGGGSLSAALWQQLPQAHIHAIELRAAVAQIAYQFFQLPRDKRLTVHTNDAVDFVSTQVKQQHKTQLLFSDLYLADGLNQVQQQTDFLAKCGEYLTPDGWLVLNLWKEHRSDAQLFSTIKKLFATVLQTTTHDGNWIIWASRQKPADKKQARINCKVLQPEFGFNPWGFCKMFYRFF